MRPQEGIQAKKAIDEHRITMCQIASYQASNNTERGQGGELPANQPTRTTNSKFINNSKHFLIISLNTNALNLPMKRL